MSLDSWLHFLHVVAAIVWLGGGLMLVMVGIRVRSSTSSEAIAEFARTIPFVGIRVLGPAWIVVLVTSVWMVLSSSEFKFTQLWVLIGLGAFAVAFLVGAVYMSQVGIRLDRAARGEDRQHANLPALLQRWLVGYSVVLVVLLVAVWDMVFKPGT
jgi:uncharacterized membrane protein